MILKKIFLSTTCVKMSLGWRPVMQEELSKLKQGDRVQLKSLLTTEEIENTNKYYGWLQEKKTLLGKSVIISSVYSDGISVKYGDRYYTFHYSNFELPKNDSEPVAKLEASTRDSELKEAFSKLKVGDQIRLKAVLTSDEKVQTEKLYQPISGDKQKLLGKLVVIDDIHTGTMCLSVKDDSYASWIFHYSNFELPKRDSGPNRDSELKEAFSKLKVGDQIRLKAVLTTEEKAQTEKLNQPISGDKQKLLGKLVAIGNIHTEYMCLAVKEYPHTSIYSIYTFHYSNFELPKRDSGPNRDSELKEAFSKVRIGDLVRLKADLTADEKAQTEKFFQPISGDKEKLLGKLVVISKITEYMCLSVKEDSHIGAYTFHYSNFELPKSDSELKEAFSKLKVGDRIRLKASLTTDEKAKTYKITLSSIGDDKKKLLGKSVVILNNLNMFLNVMADDSESFYTFHYSNFELPGDNDSDNDSDDDSDNDSDDDSDDSDNDIDDDSDNDSDDDSESEELVASMSEMPIKPFHNIILDTVMDEVKILANKTNTPFERYFFLFGGAPRDIFIGLVPKDLDFSIGLMTESQLKDLLSTVIHRLKIFGYSVKNLSNPTAVHRYLGSNIKVLSVLTIQSGQQLMNLVFSKNQQSIAPSSIGQIHVVIPDFRCNLLRMNSEGELSLWYIPEGFTTANKFSLMQTVLIDIQERRLVLASANLRHELTTDSQREFMFKQTMSMVHRGWTIDGWTSEDLGISIEKYQIIFDPKDYQAEFNYDPVAEIDWLNIEAKTRHRKKNYYL